MIIHSMNENRCEKISNDKLILPATGQKKKGSEPASASQNLFYYLGEEKVEDIIGGRSHTYGFY
jgi:hypothetical protein